MKSGCFTIIWIGRDCVASEMNYHQPHQRPVFIQRRWCCVYGGIARVFSYELLPENQMINSNKYCSQTDQLTAALHGKNCPELINRKCIIFHEYNVRPHVSLLTRQKLLQFGWEVWFICYIPKTLLHLQISIYFGLYKIVWMEKNFNF